MRINGWAVLITTWVTTSLMFFLFLIANIVLGILAGVFIGWLVSLTIFGHWINEGLTAFNIKLIDLYKIGALLGFFSGFFKFSVSKK